jgi:hypothetical protein
LTALASMSVEALVEVLADALAARIERRLSARAGGLISQHDRRGLRKRRHIEAVRRRMAEGTGGAYHIGDDYMLTPEAVREELEKYGPKGVAESGPREPSARAKRASAVSSEKAALDRELDERARELRLRRRE